MPQTYIPLYRKYRPQTFKDLVGQESLVRALSNAIKLDKVAHAYLFCGPRGTGKTSTARIFAKSLNCVKGPTLEPCGECPSCVNITNSVPVDVIEIDGASNRGVEHAQAILEKIQYAPVDGRYKIYIIDEVHMLSNFAFNALLKTLEEPPKNVIFILATTEVHKVLDTIISRCQRFDFRRITTDDIVKRLEYICEQEKINISKDALYNIAKSSQGGMRDSLALLDQISILGTDDKQIESADVDKLTGKISIDRLFEIIEKFKESDAQNALIKVNELYENGNEPSQIIANLIQYMRDLLIIKKTQDNNIILQVSKLNEQNIALMRPQAEYFESDKLIYMLDKLMYYLKEMKDVSNRQLFMELAVVELANNNSYYSYKELINKVQKLEMQISNGGSVSNCIRPVVNLPKPKIMQEIQKTVNNYAADKADTLQSLSMMNNNIQSSDNSSEVKAEESFVTNSENSLAGTQNNDKNTIRPFGVQVEESYTQTQQSSCNWNDLINNIESTPSRMFFCNQAKPIEITSERISVGFINDNFVKMAKGDSKRIPLENAAKKYFGVNSIIIEIKLVDANFEPAQKVTSSITQTVRVQEIKDFDGSNQQEQEQNNADEGYYDSLLDAKKEEAISQTVHSDGSKMVQELFDGKYI